MIPTPGVNPPEARIPPKLPRSCTDLTRSSAPAGGPIASVAVSMSSRTVFRDLCASHAFELRERAAPPPLDYIGGKRAHVSRTSPGEHGFHDQHTDGKQCYTELGIDRRCSR